MNRMLVVALGCLVLLAARSVVNGEDFDGAAEHGKPTRKPLQILGGIGVVDFPITCQHEQTQQYFNQGIALLHGYDLREADRSFYEACEIEPTCAMAWWGLAVANEENRPLAEFYVLKALELQTPVSDREKLWISTWRSCLDSGTSEFDRRTFLVASLDRIFTQYPDDLEAAAFLARQLLQNREAGIPIALNSAADLLIEQVLLHNPAHPAQHYKLLLWQEIDAERARHAAEEVQRGLPSAIRIQTAAARVFKRLKRDSDALTCLEASSAAASQRMKLDQLCPVEVEGFFENAELQIDQLAIAGRVNEAVALARQMIEMPIPYTPPHVTTENLPLSLGHGHGHGSLAGNLRPIASPVLSPETTGQQKLLQILVDFHRWDELLQLARGNYFGSTDREIQLRAIHAVGLAQFSRRDADAIAEQIEALRRLASNRFDLAPEISRLIQPARIEEAIRELRWCEAVARSEQPAETENERLARLFPETADRAVAEKLAREPVTRARSAAQALNRLRILHSTGQAEAAVASFNEVQAQFPRMDADLSNRLGFVAGGGDSDRATAKSRKSRSPYWQPPRAPRLRLSDRHGKSLTLKRLRGKPVVLVFYLGAGCPHCIEQLRSFAPLKDAYDQAGLTVIAVSTDSVAGLRETFEMAGAEDAIPFKLVSDETLSAFRDFGAFDPRDNEPLHGTFLIDPQRRIVWQNISSEPFMETRSLLDEARRVFSLNEGVPGHATLGVSIK